MPAGNDEHLERLSVSSHYRWEMHHGICVSRYQRQRLYVHQQPGFEADYQRSDRWIRLFKVSNFVFKLLNSASAEMLEVWSLHHLRGNESLRWSRIVSPEIMTLELWWSFAIVQTKSNHAAFTLNKEHFFWHLWKLLRGGIFPGYLTRQKAQSQKKFDGLFSDFTSALFFQPDLVFTHRTWIKTQNEFSLSSKSLHNVSIFGNLQEAAGQEL